MCECQYSLRYDTTTLSLWNGRISIALSPPRMWSNAGDICIQAGTNTSLWDRMTELCWIAGQTGAFYNRLTSCEWRWDGWIEPGFTCCGIEQFMVSLLVSLNTNTTSSTLKPVMCNKPIVAICSYAMNMGITTAITIQFVSSSFHYCWGATGIVGDHALNLE